MPQRSLAGTAALDTTAQRFERSEKGGLPSLTFAVEEAVDLDEVDAGEAAEGSPAGGQA